MPTTPYLALPYPGLGDAPNGPAQIQALAAAIDDLFAPWTPYVPTWTATTTNPTIGNGSWTGSRFKDIGHTTFFTMVLTIGSTTTLGSGTYSFGLPVTAFDFNGGQCVGFQVGPHRSLTGRAASTTTLYLNLANLDPAVAMTHANTALVAGSRVQVNGFYESAA